VGILIFLNTGKDDIVSAVPMMNRLILATLCATIMLPLSPSGAQQVTEVQVTYSKGQFQPGEVSAPADKPITFRVKNLDAKAMEFESKTLKVEKSRRRLQRATINVRAQKAGRYEFFDEYNANVDRGALALK
jgi:hypothetical protein